MGSPDLHLLGHVLAQVPEDKNRTLALAAPVTNRYLLAETYRLPLTGVEN